MKYLIDGIHGYSLMSDFDIIEAETRKEAISIFLEKTKGLKVTKKEIISYREKRKSEYRYIFTCMPVKVDTDRYVE